MVNIMTITIKQIETLINQINIASGQAVEPYTRTNGKLVANVGTYLISQAYGGCQLQQLVNEGGGVREITSGYVSKKELFNQLQMFLAGIEVNNK
jgi:hypothetical protein